jgi:phosphohistidine phosphatase
MTDLYLLRHGIAVAPGTAGIPDNERPLTPRGVKRMHQIGRGLCRLNVKFDRIVTSPLPRARATAEIVAEELGAEDRLETADVLRAGAGAPSIQKWLRERTENRLMIVGHDPAFTDLITLLVLGAVQAPICELKKGGIAALRSSTADSDRYNLDWLATPRLIRRLAGNKST